MREGERTHSPVARTGWDRPSLRSLFTLPSSKEELEEEEGQRPPLSAGTWALPGPPPPTPPPEGQESTDRGPQAGVTFRGGPEMEPQNGVWGEGGRSPCGSKRGGRLESRAPESEGLARERPPRPGPRGPWTAPCGRAGAPQQFRALPRGPKEPHEVTAVPSGSQALRTGGGDPRLLLALGEGHRAGALGLAAPGKGRPGAAGPDRLRLRGPRGRTPSFRHQRWLCCRHRGSRGSCGPAG